MHSLNVVLPGFLTTVQDLGRPGFAHYGVSASGAADSLSLRIGNLLVGNPENLPALEMTLVGGTFEFEEDSIIALTGSLFEARIDNSTARFWAPFQANAGQRLSMGPSLSGARCYLCVQGGLLLPQVLGSSSTHLLTGLGGLNGRVLKSGDRLPIGSAATAGTQQLLVPPSSFFDHRTIRVTPGPQADFFPANSLERFLTSTYQVSEDSNRMGLRLTGPSVTRDRTDDLVTEGVSLGAIQITHDGLPIILFVEHQTTGGYPKIANVISADLHRVGQLRPRDVVRFELVSFEAAGKLLAEQESQLAKSFRSL